MAITDIIEESSMIETGAPSIKYEGERPLKKQEMLMAGPDWDLKRMQLLMDEYGYDYDEAGEIAYDSDKYYEVIGIDPGGMGDESRNMDEEVVEEVGIMRAAAANGGPAHRIQLVKRNKDGSRPGYYGADAGFGDDDYKDAASDFQDKAQARVDAGGSGGGSEEQFRRAREAVEQRNKQAAENEKRKKEQEKKAKEQKQITTTLENQAKKKAKTKKIKDFKDLEVLPDLFEDDEEDIGFDKADTNKDGKVGPIERLNAFTNKKNVELANKRAFQKYQDIEQYVSPIDEYGITGAEAAAKVAADPTYGYDFSDLETGKAMLGSNIGTSIESYRPNLYDVNSPAPGLISVIGDKIRPDTQVTALNTLKKARDYRDLAGTGVVTREDLETLRNRGKTDDQINPPDNEPNYNNPCDGPNPPAYCFTGGKPIDEEEVVEEEWMMPLAFRAEGGRVGRAYGGIMDKYTGRRAYGLGSIFKKVKKVFKSPLGKAALLGLGGYKMGLFGSGGLGGMLSGIKSKGLGKYLSGLSTGKVAGAIGGISLATALLSPPVDEDNDGYDDKTGFDVDEWRKKGAQGSQDVPLAFRAEGGDAESGLMDLGGMEKDYREDGGFVPIGGREKADDVPARLSKNEFVFTADAVRNAGGGDVDKGAEVMYNMMKNLEAGGDVSEETQGLDGARQMFQTSQRLEEVL